MTTWHDDDDHDHDDDKTQNHPGDDLPPVPASAALAPVKHTRPCLWSGVEDGEGRGGDDEWKTEYGVEKR